MAGANAWEGAREGARGRTSPRAPLGSRYDSMKPMYDSTAGPLSLIQWREPSLCASIEPVVNDSMYASIIAVWCGLSQCGRASRRCDTTRAISGACGTCDAPPSLASLAANSCANERRQKRRVHPTRAV